MSPSDELSHPVALGAHHSPAKLTTLMALCILCQEEKLIDNENSFVVTCFLHKSKLLLNTREGNELLPELNNCTRINVRSCGHVIHSQCWGKYYASVKDREGLPILQLHRRRTCIDVSQSEYLCPLCNSLCNTVLPLLPRVAESPW